MSNQIYKRTKLLTSVRIGQEDRKLWVSAAAIEGVSLSQFLRFELRKRAKSFLNKIDREKPLGLMQRRKKKSPGERRLSPGQKEMSNENRYNTQP